jgi:hypothetical protein
MSVVYDLADQCLFIIFRHEVFVYYHQVCFILFDASYRNIIGRRVPLPCAIGHQISSEEGGPSFY